MTKKAEVTAAVEQPTKITITPENRHLYGGDARLIMAGRHKDGTMRAPATAQQRGSFLSLGPGSMINKENPTALVQISWAELSDSPHAGSHLMSMVQAGYKFCADGEWDIREDLQVILTVDAKGRIVTNTGERLRMAPMWRPKHMMDADDEANRAYSARVQQSYEEKLAQTMDELGADGSGVKGWTNEEDGARVARNSRLASR